MYRKRTRGSRKFNERMDRARVAKERLRVEGPSPEYPPDLPGLRRRVVVEDFDFGEPVRHVFELYRSTRVDCYRLVVDGNPLPGRVGWSRVLELIRKALVRVSACK